MFHITIGSTEPEPDRGFIQHVQRVIQTGRETFRKLSSTNEGGAITHLTENNIKEFARNLKIRRLVKEPIPTAKSCYFCKSDCCKQAGNFVHQKEKTGNTGFIVSDIRKLNKNIKLVRLLSVQLEHSGCAILLLNPKCKEFKHLVLQYDGTEKSIFSIQAFSKLFPSEAKNAESATLISPLSFKKSQVAAEKQFIKNTAEHYGALGFIKLPLNTVADFLGYSSKNKADLLILSQPDLMELLDIVTQKSVNKFLKRNNISVFVGFD